MRYTIGCALALLTAAAIAGSAPAHAGTYQKLFSFKGRNGGSSPQAGLLQVGNLLYGTAIDSGGTVFAFRPKTGDERVRYRFDGGQPQAPVIDVGGTLYGTTVAGGLGQYGTVYAVHPKTGKGQILYAFKGDADGYFPEAGLLNVGGTLYGTTIGGGASIGGTVFAYTIATGAKRIVYSFTDGPSDGAASHASLIEVNGLLYGTTTEGGPATEGSVFAVDLNTGVEKIIYFFTGGSDGGVPYGGLINVGGLSLAQLQQAAATRASAAAARCFPSTLPPGQKRLSTASRAALTAQTRLATSSKSATFYTEPPGAAAARARRSPAVARCIPSTSKPRRKKSFTRSRTARTAPSRCDP